MPIPYGDLNELHRDDFADFDAWHHEGIGDIERAPDGGMRLHCFGSKQGGQGCMAFFRPTLPDQIAIEYDIIPRSHGGLIINYIALRGLNGEDMIEDRNKLPERTGVMKDYWGYDWGLQSYHVSFSRFNDQGQHTGTANWRRNPGLYMVGHGNDPVTELDRSYHIRITKDAGSLQCFVDGRFAHGFVDWRDQPLPIPDTGKFGFRTIGSDVLVDIANFQVKRIDRQQKLAAEDIPEHLSES